MSNSKSLIRTIYLYLFSLVGLFIVVFGSIGLIKLALTTWVFPKADYYPRVSKPLMITETQNKALIQGLEKCENSCDLSQADKKALSSWLSDYQEWKSEQIDPKQEISRRHQRQAAQDVAMLIVGLPLFLYHWALIKKSVRKVKPVA